MSQRLTPDQLEFCVPFVERYVSNSEIIVQGLRQAASDARTIEGLRAWLDERQKWINLPGDTIGHYGLAASDTLREIDRLERQP